MKKLIAGLGLFLVVTLSGFVGSHTIVGNVNDIRFADQYTGSDCGAKINAADTELGSAAGEIWVNNSCGLAWSSPVKLSTGHVLRFSQGGTYRLSAGITIMGNAALVGPQGAMAVNTSPITMLQMAKGVNVPAIITVNGPAVTIQDLTIDGNCLPPWTNCNNPTASSGIVASNLASRLEISRVVVGNFPSNGVTLNGVGSSKIFKLMAYQNSNDGLYCNGSVGHGNDGFVTDSEFENNGGNGLAIYGCSAWRILHSDFGANSQTVAGSCGLNISGKSSFPANQEIITNNQFGSEYRNDLCITGYKRGNTSVGSNIVSNSFIGSSSLLGPTYNQISLQDGGDNIISGNVFSASNSPYSYQYAISSTETPSNGSGRSDGNVITANAYLDSFSNPGSPSWGKSRIYDPTRNGVTCQATWITLSLAWGSSGAPGNGVSEASGYLPTCSYIISSGNGSFSASPTVTFNFPGSLTAGLNSTPVCTLSVVAITGAGGAILFNPITASMKETQWTAQTSAGASFTPAASETYKVVLSCSP